MIMIDNSFSVPAGAQAPSNTLKIERTVADQIRAAVHLQKLYGLMLMQDKKVCDFLNALDVRIQETQNAMVETGIVNECADCAMSGQGTCCGRRTGYKSDSIVLLINLLLGKSLPSEPANATLCHFLTEQGCALRARHVICINFVCDRLKTAIPHKSLCYVQQKASQEIDALFMLEESIKKKIGIANLMKAAETLAL